jgi:transcriptional regulator with XRE-family HTH domain
MTDERFGQNLRAAREHAGLSQAALAEGATAILRRKIHQQTVARIEGGSQQVRLADAMALAQAARTTLDALARPAGLAQESYRILDAARSVRAARRDAALATARLGGEREKLAGLMRDAREKGLAGALASELETAARALSEDEPGYGSGPEAVRS